MHRRIVALALALLLAGCQPATAVPPAASDEIRLVDDLGRKITLARRPQRIISLAPHATELLDAAGLADLLVAVDPHSDDPPRVRSLPRINAYPTPDPERLLALRPDLIVLWGAGIGLDRLTRLESFGLNVFVSEPRSLAMIADSIERFARLSPYPQTGLERASAFREGVATLRARYSGSKPVRTFIQAWPMPLTTLSDRDTIGDAIRLCGAINSFADAPVAAAQVGIEAVLASKPDLIVALQPDASRDPWQSLGMLAPRGPIRFATLNQSIQRPSDRILPAVEALCAAVNAAR